MSVLKIVIIFHLMVMANSFGESYFYKVSARKEQLIFFWFVLQIDKRLINVFANHGKTLWYQLIRTNRKEKLAGQGKYKRNAEAPTTIAIAIIANQNDKL